MSGKKTGVRNMQYPKAKLSRRSLIRVTHSLAHGESFPRIALLRVSSRQTWTVECRWNDQKTRLQITLAYKEHLSWLEIVVHGRVVDEVVALSGAGARVCLDLVGTNQRFFWQIAYMASPTMLQPTPSGVPP